MKRCAMARILVIDDDVQLRRLIVRILKSADHEVIEAANGKEGVALFVANAPALVIPPSTDSNADAATGPTPWPRANAG